MNDRQYTAAVPALKPRAALAFLLCAWIPGCAWMSEPPTAITPTAEAYSLFGTPLVPLPAGGAARETLEVRLARARADFAADSGSADALIWVGRRTAYLGRYREAISIFSRGIREHPRDPRMLRHRGHRYITLRLLDAAVADLEAAARLAEERPDEVEPDGIPNPRNTPTSTLKSNIWYHLGLAHYLRGDFASAQRSWSECLRYSTNPDQLCATTYWLWQSLTRLGETDSARAALAPIRPDLDIIENRDYHRLLMLYQGRDSTTAVSVIADSLLAAARREGGVPLATVGYGIAGWHMARNEPGAARARLQEVLASENWAAFGYIAAEAELHRLGQRP